MGAAGVLQGMSAASVAVLLGQYQRFVSTLGNLPLGFTRHTRLTSHPPPVGMSRLALATLVVGVISGIIFIRPFFGNIIHSDPIITSSFFLGLIIMVGFLWLRSIARWNTGTLLCLLTGIAVSYAWTCLHPLQTPDHPLVAGVAGLLAGTTFVLPGVSDVFIALFFAKYRYIIASFGSLEFDVIIPFIAGVIVGTLAIARLLTQLLESYYHPVVALLAGWMIGSLNKLWPWRQVVEYTTTWEGIQIPAFEKSILPWRYLQITGKDPQLLLAILTMAAGVFIVVLVEKIAARLKTKRSHG